MRQAQAQGSTRHADRSISTSVSEPKKCPSTMRHVAKATAAAERARAQLQSPAQESRRLCCGGMYTQMPRRTTKHDDEVHSPRPRFYSAGTLSTAQDSTAQRQRAAAYVFHPSPLSSLLSYPSILCFMPEKSQKLFKEKLLRSIRETRVTALACVLFYRHA